MNIIVVFGVIWLATLTLALLLAIRQIALLTIRLNVLNTIGLDRVGSGPELGSSVNTALVRDHLLDSPARVAVFALASNCSSCHGFAESLPAEANAVDTQVVCLLTGSGPTLDSLRAYIPAWVRLIEDPVATRIGEDLELSATQVALLINGDGRLMGRAVLSEPTDLADLLQSTSPVS